MKSPIGILKSLSIAAIAVVILCALAPADKNTRAIQRQLQEYPQSCLQDIYKSFFQDQFGPGHLVSDTAAARASIHRELERMQPDTLPLYERAGAGVNFYRVNLSAVKLGLISEEELWDAFYESAKSFTLPDVAAWHRQWNEILKNVPTSLPDYELQRANIDSLLCAGKYAVHHSRLYTQTYDPHYRLIGRRIFEERLLPKLSSPDSH